MNINPEFRRNLWLELTPYRLVGMPMILGVLLLLAYILNGKQYGESVANTALVLFGLLAFLWGTRLASEALISEIRNHTWDNQRMSVIGPWSMTWGKLLGSTIYPWYGALLCLLVYLTSQPSLGLSVIETAVLLVGSGLLGQAVGLLSSLQAIRKNQRYGRFQTTAFLVLGAGCAVSVLSWPFAASMGVFWYGRYCPDDLFVLTSLVVFLGWAVFGIYRLIRAELQLKSLPWAWGLFVMFLMGYFAGFPGDGSWATGQSVWQQRLLSAFLMTLVLAYGTAFCERKDPVAFRRLLQYLGRCEWGRAMQVFPLWLSTLPFVVLTCAVLAVVDLTSGPSEGVEQVAVPAVAMVLFLLRDFGILLFLNLGRIPKRADMLTILFLVLLYGVIPTILAALDLDRLTGLFWPIQGVPAEIVLPAALFQAVAILWLMARRWRKSQLHY
jgi:hypothetical protein